MEICRRFTIFRIWKRHSRYERTGGWSWPRSTCPTCIPARPTASCNIGSRSIPACPVASARWGTTRASGSIRPPWCGPSSSRSASRESRAVSGWNRGAKSMESETDSIDLASVSHWFSGRVSIKSAWGIICVGKIIPAESSTIGNFILLLYH